MLYLILKTLPDGVHASQAREEGYIGMPRFLTGRLRAVDRRY